MEHLIAAIDPEISSETGGSPTFPYGGLGRSSETFYPMNGGTNLATFAASAVTWQTRFSQLQSFHSRHGHVEVPATSTLALWSSSQRKQYRMYVRLESGPPPHLKPQFLKEAKGVIKTRINLLNSLGFHWDVQTPPQDIDNGKKDNFKSSKAAVPDKKGEKRRMTKVTKAVVKKEKVSKKTAPKASSKSSSRAPRKPDPEPDDSEESEESEIELVDPDDLTEDQKEVSEAAIARGGCGRCKVCLRPYEDCLVCRFCKDMKKYGGPNKLRKKCELRQRQCLVNFPQAAKVERKRKREPLRAPEPPKKRGRGRPKGSGNSPSKSVTDRRNRRTTADARSKGSKSIPKRKKNRGCGECPDCLKPDCRKCKFCKDMRKYGGANQLRQRCMYRKRCRVAFPPLENEEEPESEPEPAPAVKKPRRHGQKEEEPEPIIVQSHSGRARKISRKMQESYNPSGTGIGDAQDNDNDEEMSEDEEGEMEDRKPRRMSTSRTTAGPSFPKLLLEMVNQASVESPHIMDWLPCGSAFVVKDPDAMGPILVKYFKHDKHTSFLRQLYHYGFKKHIKGYYKGAYHNPNFHRDTTDPSNISRFVTKNGTIFDEDAPDDGNEEVKDTRLRPRGTRTSPRVSRVDTERRTPRHTLLVSKPKPSTPGSSSPKKKSSLKNKGEELPFPFVLYDFVSEVAKTNPDVISWVPNGEAFIVHKTSEKDFGPILGRYFNYRKFKSFHRQLNYFGFCKPTKGEFEGAFYHPEFRRDIRSKAELRHIVSKKKSSTTTGRRKTRRSLRLGGDKNVKDSEEDNKSVEKSDEESVNEGSNDDELAALKAAVKGDSAEEEEPAPAPRVGTGRTKKVVDRKKRANIRRVQEDSDSDSDDGSDNSNSVHENEDEEYNSDDEPASIGDISADEEMHVEDERDENSDAGGDYSAGGSNADRDDDSDAGDEDSGAEEDDSLNSDDGSEGAYEDGTRSGVDDNEANSVDDSFAEQDGDEEASNDGDQDEDDGVIVV